MFSSKKRLLAFGVAAALGITAGTAYSHVRQTSGVGMYNILPYYTVQNGLNTLIHVTNIDTINGKAVKVRFRGAEWSDDVFDFTLFLSPGDIWTGAVTQNGEVASMNTSDKSCTLPTDINQDFVITRLNQSVDSEGNVTTASRNAGTREGYVEIITMADIPPIDFDDEDPQTYLYTAIKHVNGEAPCNGNLGSGVSGVLSGLEEDQGTAATLTEDETTGPDPDDNKGQGMVRPTGTLMSYAINIDIANTKAFTNEAVAVNPLGEIDGAERKIYFRQANEQLAWDRDGDYGLTADLIFADQGLILSGSNGIGGTAIPMFQFDMPDLTTPVILGADALVHRDLMTDTLTRTAAVVEYLTSDSIEASTDVVFNQPTRRFYYWYSQQEVDTEARDYTIGLESDNKYDIIGEDLDITGITDYGFGNLYSSLNGEFNFIAVEDPVFWDREEDTFIPSDDIVISPQPPIEIEPIFLVGEVAVISLNDGGLPTGALSAELTAFDYGTGLTGQDGWAILSTTGDDGPLPVIGFVAFNAFNAAAGAAGTNYGATLPLRTRNPESPPPAP
jgi:hypothetical protein